ncbi:MAG: hypothetical protein Q7U70_03470 [Methylotenera sp.]|nr:hypothetical protein [Methylotenera sp.]
MFGFLFRKKVVEEGSTFKSNLKPSAVKQTQQQAPKPEAPRISPLYEGNRGIDNLYANDTELRIWIPEPLNVAMKEAADFLRVSLSKHLRELFVIYLYGLHELLCMKENKTGIFHPPPPPKPDNGIRFSRARVVDYIPGLGKNIVPLKLFLHEKMKADLQVLADKAGLPLSQFVREILVSHFLGHTVWPERNSLWTREQQEIAHGWELGTIEEDGITSPTDDEEAALEGKVEVLHW